MCGSMRTRSKKLKRSASLDGMSDFSPTKRRKTVKGFGSLLNKLKSGSPSKRPSKSSINVTLTKKVWPAGLPVEIFELIIAYLPRSTIQNMRLVNRDFEQKVAGYFFKDVVVPFSPELYGIAPEPRLGQQADVTLRTSVLLPDKGMRVFQGFGKYIRKFALSFEFDPNKLANPPPKNDQEAIQSFWGIYRWPFKKYNRYSQLEGLEMTADETRTMASALRWITNASHLGLSIDGGLGWLSGPDCNARVNERDPSSKVFGNSRFVPELEPTKRTSGCQGLFSEGYSSNGMPSTALERMLQAAGVESDAISEAVRMVIEIDETARELQAIQLDGLSSSEEAALASIDFQQSGRLTSVATHMVETADTQVAQLITNTAQATITPNESITSDGSTGDISENGRDAVTQNLSANGRNISSRNKNEPYPLKPNDLTSAQKEMLLETEWAQRAFMQSYAIAVIDNPATFRSITTLAIARLPSRHLPILRREDFWDSLPGLTELSLAVIPDWREVVKLPTSWVQDNKIHPSKAISGVYQLLQGQIAHRQNIKTLHFEWLCGGEHAPGLFARNHHVLAAPVVAEPNLMISRSHALPFVLSFPHLEKLSLKNCWISPHIMARFVSSFNNSALQNLTLESVSLSAGVPMNTQPGPANGAGAHAQHLANWMQNVQVNAGAAIGAQVPPHLANFMGAQPPANNLAFVAAQQAIAAAAAANPGAAAAAMAALNTQNAQNAQNVAQPAAPPTNWLDYRIGSWTNIIELLTPSERKSIKYRRQKVKEPDFEPTGHTSSLVPTLKTLVLKSCGYVRLHLDFDQTVLDAPEIPAPPPSGIVKRMAEIESHMMKPQDHYLGEIINYVSPAEMLQLQSVFVMHFGWDGMEEPYGTTLALDSGLDGILKPGEGRFSGEIGRDASTS